MTIDAERLSQQVKLAYEFMEALHGQALALIKDVETQLGQAPEELECLRPGGYRYTMNRISAGLERPQPTIAGFYAVFFRHFTGRSKTTPLDYDRPIGFIQVVLRERGLEHPEVRFGIVTKVIKPEDRANKWPQKFEDLVTHIADLALRGPTWANQVAVEQHYQDSYINSTIRGGTVKLADLPDSEAIATRIVEPLLTLYREAAS